MRTSTKFSVWVCSSGTHRSTVENQCHLLLPLHNITKILLKKYNWWEDDQTGFHIFFPETLELSHWESLKVWSFSRTESVHLGDTGWRGGICWGFRSGCKCDPGVIRGELFSECEKNWAPVFISRGQDRKRARGRGRSWDSGYFLLRTQLTNHCAEELSCQERWGRRPLVSL